MNVAARGAARGVCSSFIASLSHGQVVPIEVTNKAQVSGAGLMFRFDRPALLVSPGTGIAPMRSHTCHLTGRAATLPAALAICRPRSLPPLPTSTSRHGRVLILHVRLLQHVTHAACRSGSRRT